MSCNGWVDADMRASDALHAMPSGPIFAETVSYRFVNAYVLQAHTHVEHPKMLSGSLGAPAAAK